MRWLYAFIQITNLWGFVALWILKCEPPPNGTKLKFSLVSGECSAVLKMSFFWEGITILREHRVLPLRGCMT